MDCNGKGLNDPDFRGAVCVVRKDEVILERVNGFAGASAGKAFVAVGILQLIESGKLRFEDTIGDILAIDLNRIDPLVTVKDIVRFWRGLTCGKLLSVKLVSEMLRDQGAQCPDRKEGRYGCGFWLYSGDGEEELPYFQGCDPGVGFLSEYHPQKGMISVLVSNYGDKVWRQMRRLRAALYG